MIKAKRKYNNRARRLRTAAARTKAQQIQTPIANNNPTWKSMETGGKVVEGH